MLRTLALHVCRQRKPNYGILVPLIYAPLLPLSEACSSPMLLGLSCDLIRRKSDTFRVHMYYCTTCHARNDEGAAAFPAVRIGLRNRVSPGRRDAVFGAAVLTALAHAGYVSY